MMQPSTSEVVRLLTQGSDDRGFVTAATVDAPTESVGPAGQYNLKEIEARLTAAIAAIAADPTPVTVDLDALADKVAERLGGKLDQLLTRLAAAGDALDG
jgi:hypothetical protein